MIAEHSWIDFGREFAELEDELKEKNLSLPGLMIESEHGHQFLVGHINELGGTCDDCRAISFGTIIKRYRVIWQGPTPL